MAMYHTPMAMHTPQSTDASREAECAASLAPRPAPAKVLARRDGAGMQPGRERLKRGVVLEQVGPIPVRGLGRRSSVSGRPLEG